jgi:replicative DNA helicase
LHVAEVADLQVVDSENTYPLDMEPFDEALLGGVSFGELVVVAGQSGHGKTTLIQDWTVTLATGGKQKKVKLPALWFSYEVLAKPMWKKFQSMGATKETPIYMPRVTETGEIDWVFEAIEKAIDKYGVKVIAIDHLGFLKSPRGNYANAADAVTHTVRNLKRLAVKKGLIIMLPVHIRKTISKIPDLNDIRDSLGIAQEADSVFFISREKDSSGMPSTQSKVWLIKNRKSGASVAATFDFQFGRYYYNPDADKKKQPKPKEIKNMGFKDDFGPDEEPDFGNDKF